MVRTTIKGQDRAQLPAQVGVGAILIQPQISCILAVPLSSRRIWLRRRKAERATKYPALPRSRSVRNW